MLKNYSEARRVASAALFLLSALVATTAMGADATSKNPPKQDPKDLKELISKIRSCPDCRNTDEKIEGALAMIENLLESGLLNDDTAEDYRKNLGNTEFDRIKKKLSKLSSRDVGQLEDLDRDITHWMQRYEEFEKSKDAGNRLRLDIAKKLAEGEHRTTRGIRSAREIYDELAESSDISVSLRHSAELGADSARKELLKAELAEHVESEIASGATPAAIQQTLLQHDSLRDYSTDLESEIQSSCSSAEASSFQRCAEVRQRAMVQQSEVQALLYQQLSMAQVQYQQIQMEMMRQQQEAQMRSFQNFANPYGGFSGYPRAGW
jgi:hypothetical protein